MNQVSEEIFPDFLTTSSDLVYAKPKNIDSLIVEDLKKRNKTFEEHYYPWVKLN